VTNLIDNDLWRIQQKTVNFGLLKKVIGADADPGFSIDLNFQDVMTSKLKNLDVSVQNLEVMQ